MTNAANYLDVPFALDAMCAAIALNMRQTARDFKDKNGKSLSVNIQED